MRHPLSLAVALSLGAFTTACANATAPPQIAYDPKAMAPAKLQAEPPPKAVQIVQMPKPLPLPGQLKPIGPNAGPPTPVQVARAHHSAHERPHDPAHRVSDANAAARVQPVDDNYVNAIQVYPYVEGALYQVYAAPGEVTDIALQPGETLTGSGPVAAGDTVRWIIGNAESGSGAAKQTHILLKPTGPALITNLVINTDLRTYHLELRATPAAYMASVSWRYPQDQLVALQARSTAADAAAPATSGIDLANLQFRYRITGDAPPWRPLRAYDDGRRVFIEFPAGISQGEMPPLFVVSADGKSGELVNYHVRGPKMIVDQLFAAAELKLGGKAQAHVRIERTDAVSKAATP